MLVDDLGQVAGRLGVVADADPGEAVGAEAAPDAAGEAASASRRDGQVGEQGVAGAVAVLGVPAAEAVEVHRHERAGWAEEAAWTTPPTWRVKARVSRKPESGSVSDWPCIAQQGAEAPEEERGDDPHQRAAAPPGPARWPGRPAPGPMAASMVFEGPRTACASVTRIGRRGGEGRAAPSRACSRASRGRGPRRRAAGDEERHQPVRQRPGRRRRRRTRRTPPAGHGRAADRVVEGGQQQQVEGDRHQQGDVLGRGQATAPRASPTTIDEEHREHRELDRRALRALAARLAPAPAGAAATARGTRRGRPAGSRSATTRPGCWTSPPVARKSEVRHAAEGPAREADGESAARTAPRRPSSAARRPAAAREAEPGDGADEQHAERRGDRQVHDPRAGRARRHEEQHGRRAGERRRTMARSSGARRPRELRIAITPMVSAAGMQRPETRGTRACRERS